MTDDGPGYGIFADLSAIVVLAGTTIVVVLASDSLPFASAVRIIVGVPFLLFLPGYLLTLSLYPRSRYERGREMSATSFHRRVLTPVERVALSVALSLVVVAVTALTATLTPRGISEGPVVFGTVGVTLLAVTVAAEKQRHVPPGSRPTGIVSSSKITVPLSLRNESQWVILLNVAMIVSVAVALTAVAFQPFGSPDSDRFSEYQLLVEGSDGELVVGNYSSEFTEGENASIFVRVQNHEERPVNYTVVSQLQRVNGTGASPQVIEVVAQDRFHVAVNAGNSRTIERSPTTPNGEFRLVYLFYKGDAPDDPTPANANAILHLWIGGSEA